MNRPSLARWTCLALLLAGSTLTESVEESAPMARSSNYRGWKSLCLSNSLVELQVLPDIGGRIIQFKFGGKEFLWVNPSLAGKLLPANGLAVDGGWFNVGGDKLWPAPQAWDNDQQWPGPPDAVLKAQPYSLEQFRPKRRQSAIRLTSAGDPRCGIFAPGMLEAVVHDPRGRAVARQRLAAPVTPLAGATVNITLRAPACGSTAAIMALGADGQARGELARCAIRRP